MTPTPLLKLLPGPFNFLRQDPEEVRRLVPDLASALPTPRPVFLDDEAATPARGFVVLLSEPMAALRAALKQYLLVEEGVQLAILGRESYDRKLYAAAWERYRALLARALENATISSYGRRYPGVFWLHHSLDVARLLKETPKRILRQDLTAGRRHGETIRYRVLDRYLDRVLEESYDVVQRVADATEEVEEELFPRLLTRMRDNVLIFTEDHISRDLAELGGYFAACLRIDGRDLRQRFEELARWHAAELEADRELRSAVAHLLRARTDGNGRELLNHPGYVSFLASRRSYSPSRLLPPPLVEVWESLLVKLKEFELFHGLRRSFLLVEREPGGRLVCRDPGTARAAAGGPAVALSPATRPLDFMQPWVVDPRVDRFGLIYDISDFSQTVSVLHRSGTDTQDEAFRMMFRYQRRVNRLASSRRVKLEKYLGDGAFYSSREAANLLYCAIHLQRFYQQALAEGFPFDQGLRVALNHGHYRLIPMGGGGPEEGERYEFFGHGLVELSRLVTGKAAREIEEVKTLLLHLGYPAVAVHRFFEPLARTNLDVVDKTEEARPFHAYLDRNGNLVNRGIVATEAYVAQLAKELPPGDLFRAADGERIYVVLHVGEGTERLAAGLRKLGAAHLKGLEQLPVYEIVDGEELAGAAMEPLAAAGLLAAVERAFRDRGALAAGPAAKEG